MFLYPSNRRSINQSSNRQSINQLIKTSNYPIIQTGVSRMQDDDFRGAIECGLEALRLSEHSQARNGQTQRQVNWVVSFHFCWYGSCISQVLVVDPCVDYSVFWLNHILGNWLIDWLIDWVWKTERLRVSPCCSTIWASSRRAYS
jgi:hypothetical protein